MKIYFGHIDGLSRTRWHIHAPLHTCRRTLCNFHTPFTLSHTLSHFHTPFHIFKHLFTLSCIPLHFHTPLHNFIYPFIFSHIFSHFHTPLHILMLSLQFHAFFHIFTHPFTLSRTFLNFHSPTYTFMHPFTFWWIILVDILILQTLSHFQWVYQGIGVNEHHRERKYNDAHNFFEKLKVKGHMETVKEIKNTLTHAQKELFKKGCFRWFLKMETLKHSSSLLHSMLFLQINKRVVGEELWLRLNWVDCRFSLVEFALIIRLKFNKEMDNSKVTRKSHFKLRYFVGNKLVTYGDFATIYKEKEWENNDEDVIKIYALYLFHYGLLGSDNRKIILEHVSV